ncbi:MAG: hypothetical protein NTV29_13820 [Planctomycetota bacterium]|nr:hypothetical protein [Planctomycetota bacterium]
MADSMTNNGFFGWIRQGVKQSVLLGVSDALDALGTVDSNESYHPSIAKAIGSGAVESLGTGLGPIDAAQGSADGLPTSNRTPRKRLGKSLKDLNPQGVSKPKPQQDSSS